MNKPIPTSCNGRTSWDVVGPVNESRGGGHDWANVPYKLVVTGDNKLIVKEYFGGNWETGMTIDTTYQWRTTRKKKVQLTDHYICENGKPKFISTRVCVRHGEMKEFLPAWWATIFKVENNGMTWDPPLDKKTDCYTNSH